MDKSHEQTLLEQNEALQRMEGELAATRARLTQKEQENKYLREYNSSLRAQLKTYTSIKTKFKRIPLFIPLSRLVRGDINGVKWYFKEQKLDREIQNIEKQINEEELFELYDMSYLDRIMDRISQMPISNGCRYYQKHPVRIGWLAEQFRYDALSCAADGIVLTPRNWKQGIENIDLLFVTSGWNGVNRAWPDFGKSGSPSRKTADEVIAACKGKKIPTVFYSMEDPPNYLIFIDLAKKCDCVFTAAEEMIPQYKKDCGHDRIYLLKASVNPLMHNPVGMRKFDRSEKVFFAGSWMRKYPERIKDTCMMFDGALQAGNGLRILDRNMFRMEKRYYFPKEYARYVAPPVDHDTLQKIHKLYDWGFTLNSVKDSRTMFANRAYEMLALGNLILSDNCLGVKTQIPTAFICTSKEQTAQILRSLSAEERYRLQMEGLRYVFRHDTSFDRMETVLDAIGMTGADNHRSIAVVIASEKPEKEPMFLHQTYPWKTALTPEQWRDTAEKYDMVAFFDLKAHYGKHYLEDMVNGFKYTGCDYVTKAAYFSNGELCEGPEHDYVSLMPCKTRSVFWTKAYSVQMLDTMRDGIELANGYAIDHFEYEAN